MAIPWEGTGWKSDFRQLAAVWATALVCLAPWLAKPFHIDDPLFVWTAEQVAQRPFDPFGFSVNWGGYSTPMHTETKNPPLTAYYLALVGRVAGFSEAVLHGAMLLAVLVVLSLVFCLARDLGADPIISALTTLATPVFVISASTVMSDVPLLAPWLAAIWWWRRGVLRGKRRLLALSAIVMGLAALTKYYGVALLPLLAVWTVLVRRRATVELCWLAIPLAIVAGYEGLTWARYGSGMFADAVAYALRFGPAGQGVGPGAGEPMDPGGFGSAVSVGLMFLGGCLLSVLCFAPARWPPGVLATAGLCAAAAAGVVWQIPRLGTLSLPAEEPLRAVLAAHAGLFGVAGMLLLALGVQAVWQQPQNADAWLLSLWLVGTFAFAALVNWTVNGRSLLPAAPAVAILMARGRAARCAVLGAPSAGPTSRARRTWGTWTSVCCALCISTATVWGDVRYAIAARDAARELSHTYREGNQLPRFAGHWGFQYYAQQAGGRPLDFLGDRVGTHEWLILPRANVGVVHFPEKYYARHEHRSFRASRWVATTCQALGASFYSSVQGPFPWVVAPVPDCGYDVVQLVQPLELRGPSEATAR